MATQQGSHPQEPPSAAYLEAVGEIMRVYLSLPPRPTIDEVEAAVAVIRSTDAEEKAQLEDLGRVEKPPDVPDELFFILQETRKKMVQLQCYDQRREAAHVLEMENRFREFDDLVQRASRAVSGGEGAVGEEKEDGRAEKVGVFDAEGPRLDGMLLDVEVKTEQRRKKDLETGKEMIRDSSLKSTAAAVTGDTQDSKLSLIKVAGIIETSAKNGVKILDLQGKLMDQIEWLPVSLGKLLDVMELNLSENRILALPSTIGSLKYLTKLDLHSNQLINLPESFVELSSLTDLDLHGNQLKSLPTAFGNLTSLISLDVSSNRLTHLPESIGNLSCLRRLDVETNDLEELPYTIGSCSSLEELRLDFNQLRALPEAVGKLESLQILTLHYNRIRGLPTTMASLTNLRELDVSFNEVELIPESLCFATSLVKLIVGNNFADLRALPRNIGNLEKLEELDISNNQIRFLPESFRYLSKLKVLNADEAPLEVPPREVVKLGAQAVVQYMVDLVEAKNQPPKTRERPGFWHWLYMLCCGNGTYA